MYVVKLILDKGHASVGVRHDVISVLRGVRLFEVLEQKKFDMIKPIGKRARLSRGIAFNDAFPDVHQQSHFTTLRAL
jgi:hypothetical protein